MGASSASSHMNSARISLLVDNLALHVKQTHQNDHTNFCSFCLSLSRYIDFAVANSHVPSRAQELPLLLKQICQKNNSHYAKAAIMVLMISIKNACKNGWFSDKETEELISLANEIGNDFFGCGDTNAGQSSSLITITTIMERFYPRLKIGQIVAYVEVKPGYGAFAFDFHFSKIMQFSPQEKIRLFVAQRDNTETSACIISPPQVNFLVNGRGVNGRTNVFMDTGPQLPTNIGHMLKLGSNLLQAVGNFDAVAFMSPAPPPDSSVLQNYVQPAVANADSDAELIEGPSRISLNCPISYTRIKVPVKGRSCKHFQCFDFYNFVDINSRRPSWRCPHCNQYICYLDICVDQDMFKVLREVAENVTEVIISADGSWKAILENDYGDSQPLEGSLNHQNERAQQESTAPPNVLDLTQVDDMDTTCSVETEDRKPPSSDLRNRSIPTSLNVSSGMNMSGMLDDDFWAGIVSDGILISSTRSHAPIGNFTPATGFVDMQSAVLTDAVAPVLTSRVGVHGHVSPPAPAFHDQNSLQVQVINSNENNQYGRVASIPRHVSRTPIAIQALPAQPQTSGRQHGSRTSTVPSAPHVGQNITSGDGLDTAISRDSETWQQLSTRHGNQLHAANLSASFQRPSTAQNRDLQARPFTAGQTVHLTPTSTLRALSDFQNAHLQQALNSRMPQIRNQNPRVVRPPSPLPRAMSPVGGEYGVAAYAGITPSSQRARMMVGSQRAEMPRQSPYMSLQNQIPTQSPRFMPIQNQMPTQSPPFTPLQNQIPTQSPFTSLQNQIPTSSHSFQTMTDGLTPSPREPRYVGGMSQPLHMADGSLDTSLEQNWQPTGRMRGSLAGRYTAALEQYMIQPTQHVQQYARPSSYTTAASPGAVPSNQAQTLSNRDANVPQTK